MGYHERLIELRKKNNYTQEELAGIIGVSRQAISNGNQEWPIRI